MSPTYSVCADHGYITGEHYSCPDCGKTTEVYSRITGYYRPVQNWNDGKAQEYKDRKVYNVGFETADWGKSDCCTPAAPIIVEKTPVVEEVAPAVAENAQAILFSRVTCPNCRVAENLLGKAGIAYEKKIAEENIDLCKQYGVKGAPTLIITDGTNYQSYYSVPEIKKYLASL